MVRKIVSLTALLSFLATLGASVICIVPHGRVAYWADWPFLWLTKADWGANLPPRGVCAVTRGE
ncbi:MAG: hypothetical protein V3571_15005 [Pseudodesulfovibrio sp.]